MPAYTFTEPQVTEAIEAVVAERGEGYVYPQDGQANSEWSAAFGCRYVTAPPEGSDREPQPGCIVGATFARLGVPLDVMAQKEAVDSWNLIHTIDVDVPVNVGSALRAAQGQQDSYQPWGEALTAYRRNLGD